MPDLPPTRDRVTLTFEVERDIWDLLKTLVGPGDDWQDIAARALEAGLEQVASPTLTRDPFRRSER
ncbi:MAG: hypothetical protein KC503_35965 [Myxococcales bacterium]|nr:hypothetical protein [Myxococcales bacterium]